MDKAEEFQIFHDIVNASSISPKITAFFENLKASTESDSAAGTIKILNEMLKKNEPLNIAFSKNAPKDTVPADLLGWFALLHNIFIVRWRKAENKGESKKSPVFCTFHRTFETPAFYPEYWFQTPMEKKNIRKLIAAPTELLIAFDRYMYDGDGAACWTAVDLNLDKFIYRCICQPSRISIGVEDPCAKIASLLLAAHKIVSGRLGLYVSKSQDIELKYAGVSTGNPSLLKYFHYDRHTKYSYILQREREKKKDADATSPYPEFEQRWASLAAMTEFILQNKSARATKTTCSRVSIETLVKCLMQLRNESSLQSNAEAMAMIEKGLDLLDEENFASMSAENVLEALKYDKKIIPADYYLNKYELKSADAFWELAAAVFEAFIEKFNNSYYALLDHDRGSVTGTKPLKKAVGAVSDDSKNLLNCLLFEQIGELRGRLVGSRLRAALKTLLLNGDLEFHTMQLWSILQKNVNRAPFIFFNPHWRKQALQLPYQWLCSDIPSKDIASELNIWAREILSELTKDKKENIVLNFSAVNFAAIQEASDKVWDIYFNPEYESAVKSRYIISLLEARNIISSDKEKYAGIKLTTGSARNELLRYINEELNTLTGGVDLDIEKEKADFAKRKIYCFADFSPTWQRCFVILDLLARLVVTAAKNEIFTAIWNNMDERIRFITHILSATHSYLDHPFPYHIGLQGDTVLRISRGTDQRDHLTRLANHSYENLAEQYCFLMALGRYLQQEEEPVKLLQTIMNTPSLADFAEPDQLDHLLQTFMGGK